MNPFLQTTQVHLRVEDPTHITSYPSVRYTHVPLPPRTGGAARPRWNSPPVPSLRVGGPHPYHIVHLDAVPSVHPCYPSCAVDSSPPAAPHHPSSLRPRRTEPYLDHYFRGARQLFSVFLNAVLCPCYVVGPTDSNNPRRTPRDAGGFVEKTPIT